MARFFIELTQTQRKELLEQAQQLKEQTKKINKQYNDLMKSLNKIGIEEETNIKEHRKIKELYQEKGKHKIQLNEVGDIEHYLILDAKGRYDFTVAYGDAMKDEYNYFITGENIIKKVYNSDFSFMTLQAEKNNFLTLNCKEKLEKMELIVRSEDFFEILLKDKAKKIDIIISYDGETD